MSELIKVFFIALTTVFAYLLIKQTKPEFAMFIALAGGIIITIMTVDSIKIATKSVTQMFSNSSFDKNLILPLVKIVAIGYVAEFGANICIDANVNSLADKILFSAKIIILVLALPIVESVISLVVGLI